MFSKELNAKLDEFHLLKHPFYQAWNEGKLSREIIKDYAEQYYHHVKAFPRYISATHSICEDIANRKILLENLNDEEDKHNDHPKLWKQFAVALGSDKNEIEKVKSIASTLVAEFRTAASIVDEEVDSRQKWIEQLKELHFNLRDITIHHPCLTVDKIAQQNENSFVTASDDHQIAIWSHEA